LGFNGTVAQMWFENYDAVKK